MKSAHLFCPEPQRSVDRIGCVTSEPVPTTRSHPFGVQLACFIYEPSKRPLAVSKHFRQQALDEYMMGNETQPSERLPIFNAVVHEHGVTLILELVFVPPKRERPGLLFIDETIGRFPHADLGAPIDRHPQQ